MIALSHARPAKERCSRQEAGDHRLTCREAYSRPQVHDCAVQVLSQRAHGHQHIVALAVHAAVATAVQDLIALRLADHSH